MSSALLRAAIRRARGAARRLLLPRIRQRRLRRLLSEGFPELFAEATRFLITGKADEAACSTANKIESIRNAIASQGDKKVTIWYSPKPGSSGDHVTSDLKPQPGKVLEFTMKQIAHRASKNRLWGLFLHLLVRTFNAKTVVELGSCAGISGCYLASPPSVETFITVEGSPHLAQLARESFHTIFPRAIVLNMLFDDAIDNEIPRFLKTKIDFIYIDGHHEKIATIHYFEKIMPHLSDQAVVVFDDVSWSSDMREAWNILSSSSVFSHSMDFGALGVCLFERNRTRQGQYWNLQPVVGFVKIGDPEGWKA